MSKSTNNQTATQNTAKKSDNTAKSAKFTCTFAELSKNVTLKSKDFTLFDDTVCEDVTINKNCLSKSIDYFTLRRIDSKKHVDSRNLVSIRVKSTTIELMFNKEHDKIAKKYEKRENCTVSNQKKNNCIILYTIRSKDFKIIESVLNDCIDFETSKTTVKTATEKTVKSEEVAK